VSRSRSWGEPFDSESLHFRTLADNGQRCSFPGASYAVQSNDLLAAYEYVVHCLEL
jgi:hypothetical protein